jgi:hypothetical protein
MLRAVASGGEERGGWLRDAWAVRALWRLLARETGRTGEAVPQHREELIAVLRAARARLRRRLLDAEGVDPGTGRLEG